METGCLLAICDVFASPFNCREPDLQSLDFSLFALLLGSNQSIHQARTVQNCMHVATVGVNALSIARRSALSHSSFRNSAWLLVAKRYQITAATAGTSLRMASTSSSKTLTKDKAYDEHWQQPHGTPLPSLKVFNSLTRSKVRLDNCRKRV